jgi:hypothetical protein
MKKNEMSGHEEMHARFVSKTSSENLDVDRSMAFKMDLKEIVWSIVDWNNLAQDKD